MVTGKTRVIGKNSGLSNRFYQYMCFPSIEGARAPDPFPFPTAMKIITEIGQMQIWMTLQTKSSTQAHHHQFLASKSISVDVTPFKAPSQPNAGCRAGHPVPDNRSGCSRTPATSIAHTSSTSNTFRYVACDWAVLCCIVRASFC